MLVITVEKVLKKNYINRLGCTVCLLFKVPGFRAAAMHILFSLLLLGLFSVKALGQHVQGGEVLNLSVKVFLEGPYKGAGNMNVALTPFLKAFESTSPLSPDAKVGKMKPGFTVPAQAVDVVTIELRPFDNKVLTNATAFAWLMEDGSIRDFETGTKAHLSFASLPVSANGWHVVVKHRNHLTVMSSVGVPVTLVAGVPGQSASQGFIDLTKRENIYGAGFITALPSASSPALMIAGNADNSNQRMTAQDFDLIKHDADSPLDMGYKNTDFNLDGKCNAIDADKVMLPSANSFLVSTALNP